VIFPPTACGGLAERLPMKQWLGRVITLVLLVTAQAAVAEDSPGPARLVFGSFKSVQNATNWASRLSLRLNANIVTQSYQQTDGIWHRVVSERLPPDSLMQLGRVAESQQLRFWRLLDDGVEIAGPVDPQAPPPVAAPAVRSQEALRHPAREVTESRRDSTVQMFDIDLGMQSRTFFQSGLDGQSKFHPSFSLRADYYRSWDNEQQSFTASPFFRYDAQDGDRTHFDLREFFWTRVADTWDVHVGVKQVFWGVTEFNHLVDIINQTDLVDNIDQEEKLGQPMAHLSLIRDWGILDFHLLTGFRERTFAGEDGRLRRAIPVDTNGAEYESGAEDRRVDGAIRWSHNLGPLDFGLYHFSGTSRDPQFELRQKANGDYYLKPYYPVIDQTGFDGQMIFGDWAWKLEAITRSGFGDRYAAMTGGFERTLVGVLGGRTDLGLIAEYMWDERDDEAFNTVFEHDLALGTRWQLNDMSDTQALLGLIWDVESNEYIVKLEASRRLGDTWTLLIEGRAFGGADEPDADDPLPDLLDPDNKLGALTRDDFLQLEVTRYF
jgi:hypothetical protein